MHRKMSIIQEELIDLQKLIQSTDASCRMFPDDKLLRITLKGLFARQEKLQEELVLAASIGTEEVLTVHIPEGPIRGFTISIPFLSSFLRATQNVVKEIGISLKFGAARPKNIKHEFEQDFQLGLLGISYGSFGLVLGRFGPRNLAAFGTPLNESIDEFYSLLECKADKALIKKKVHELGLYVAYTYKAMVRTVFEAGASTVITRRCERRPMRQFEITSPLAKDVFDIVNQIEIGETSSIELLGTIKGLSLLKKTFEFVQTGSEKPITGKYNPEVEDRAKAFFDKFVRAQFETSFRISEVTEKVARTYHLVEIIKLHS